MIMKIKLVAVLLVIFLLAGGTVSVSSIDIDQSESSNNFVKQGYHTNYNDLNETMKIVQIFGPLTSRYSEIELIDGPEAKINRINNMFNSIITRIIIPFAVIYAENITFKVSFKKVPIIDNSRFSYITFWGDYVNGSMENITYYFNEIHTVKVTNLSGFFLITKARPIRLTPSYFWIVGEYEKIIAEV